MFVKVDDEDYDELIKYHWYLREQKNANYAITTINLGNGKQKSISIHRFIMKVTDPKILIDHINGDGLDDQKSNLRTCTPSQNQSRRMVIKGVSKFKGVTLHNVKRKHKMIDGSEKIYQYKVYFVTITLNGVKKHLGSFPFTPEGEISAALKYNEGAKQLFGEFAFLNIIE